MVHKVLGHRVQMSTKDTEASLGDIEISLSRHFLAMAQVYPWKWSPIDAAWILMRERKRNRTTERKPEKVASNERSRNGQKKQPGSANKWGKGQMGDTGSSISITGKQ